MDEDPSELLRAVVVRSRRLAAVVVLSHVSLVVGMALLLVTPQPLLLTPAWLAIYLSLAACAVGGGEYVVKRVARSAVPSQWMRRSKVETAVRMRFLSPKLTAAAVHSLLERSTAP